MGAARTRPWNIGVLINQLDGSYQSLIWHNIQKAAAKLKIQFTLFSGKPLLSPYENEVQYNAVYSLANSASVDGILVLSGVLTTFTTIEHCKQVLAQFATKPIVSLAVKIDPYPAVLVQGQTGVRESIVHLVREHGLERIAYVKGADTHIESSQRYQSYLDTLEELGIPFESNLVYQGNLVFDTGRSAVKEFLDNRLVFPQAIVTANDEMLLGVYQELSERNVEVPKQIALVGFDDTPQVRIQHPPATSVRQPFYEQVERSLELLLDRIEDRDVPPDVTLPSELVVRESCGCPSWLVKELRQVRSLVDAERHEFEDLWSDVARDVASEVGIGNPAVTDSEFFAIAAIKSFVVDAVAVLRSKLALADFVERFHQTLVRSMREKFEVGYWREALSSIRKKLEVSLPVSIERTSIDEVYQSALTMYFEVRSRQQESSLFDRELMEGILLHSCQIIVASFHERDLVEALRRSLPRLGFRRFAVVRFDEKVRFDQNLAWQIPSRARLLVAHDPAHRSTFPADYVFETGELLPSPLFDLAPGSGTVVLPLFFRTDHFGYFVLEVDQQPDAFYEILRGQISVALMGIEYVQEQEKSSHALTKALRALEESYQKLETLAVVDELTGLFNRRGFMAVAQKSIDGTARHEQESLLFFIDLDGLKTINDTFGHSEGDEAIVRTAEILSRAFRQSDVCCRLSGDEFVVFATQIGAQRQESQVQRIEELTRQYNETSGKPYRLSMSIGVAQLSQEESTTLEELMRKADQNLYEIKRWKKRAIEGSASSEP